MKSGHLLFVPNRLWQVPHSFRAAILALTDDTTHTHRHSSCKLFNTSNANTTKHTYKQAGPSKKSFIRFIIVWLCRIG
ncbi:hypothetical protein T07_6154 [Trichinella nelsoni]|uniref:Uncharacterized protein n=1 Tax=Trichinella nelsoni TaxID=6336 RepID=A0A0V0SJC6_9BILA|nr:hypothetical protein T07_6154 [Trichinella nelsoni]